MPLSKSASQTTTNSPSVLKYWVLASRPKTWIASLSPVLIGTVLSGVHSWKLFFLALLFSLLIQIGTNYANDYYDFLKGADNSERKGPKRAVASGWISPSNMKKGWIATFGAAFCIALPIALSFGSWTLIVILSSIVFGILYTGGPKPLGYMGLGEVLVFFYFGPIAVVGSYFVQMHTCPFHVVLLSFSPGLLSAAILIANNLRDLQTDQAAEKKTLVVRFGKIFGAIEYCVCITLALLIPVFFGLYTPMILAPPAIFLIRKAFCDEDSLLAPTALLLLLFTLFFCAEIILYQ